MELVFTRDTFTDQSTGSICTCDETSIGFGLELPWRFGANLPNKTAILEGRYEATIYVSPHLSELASKRAGKRVDVEVLLLHGVPGRQLCEVHPANRPSELLGCCAPGLERGVDEVMRSAQAHGWIMALAHQAVSRGEKIYVTFRSARARAGEEEI